MKWTVFSLTAFFHLHPVKEASLIGSLPDASFPASPQRKDLCPLKLLLWNWEGRWSCDGPLEAEQQANMELLFPLQVDETCT